MLVLDGADQPPSELDRLRVKVVHPERAHAMTDPKAEDPEHFLPEGKGFGAVEVERVDVLLLLGRILSVLDGAIGPVKEPLRVLADPEARRHKALSQSVREKRTSSSVKNGDLAAFIDARDIEGSSPYSRSLAA